MKRSFFILFTGLLIIMLIIYYVMQSRKESQIMVDNFSMTDIQFLTDDSTHGALTVELNIDLPKQYRDQKILDTVKTIIYAELFGNKYTTYPEDSLLQYYTSELKTEYLANNADFAEKISDESPLALNNTLILEGFALLNDEHIFSYGISRFVDFGGAHPIKTRLFYNFDLTDGTIIFEDDIFINGYLPELTEIIKNKLFENLDGIEDPAFRDIKNDELYFIDELKPNGNFYINDESVCYVFNPYEIAPYFVGETEVILPYEMIYHLMKPDNPLNYLVSAALQNKN